MESSSDHITQTHYLSSLSSSSLDGARNYQSAIIFLGTGSSGTVPDARCLLQPSIPPCEVCHPPRSISPENNPNYRCNTSLLIDYCRNNDERSYILIDCGKTFREQVLRWFTLHKIPRVDSIILTHEHADAVNGLVDFCVIQQVSPTPVYLTQHSMKSIASKFPYLIRGEQEEFVKVSTTTQLEWKIIESNCETAFVASDLRFIPLPVMHGEDYISLGFLFGEKCRVAYISDVSRFPESTEHKTVAGQLDILILDCNNKKESVSSGRGAHLCLPQALEIVKKLCPKQAFLIGMNHTFDHHKDNELLREWSTKEGTLVQLARDGMRISVEL